MNGNWCYKFLDAKVSHSTIELGDTVEIKTKIEQLLESNVVKGQIEIHLTILDPDNLKHVKSVTKFTNRGETWMLILHFLQRK